MPKHILIVFLKPGVTSAIHTRGTDTSDIWKPEKEISILSAFFQSILPNKLNIPR